MQPCCLAAHPIASDPHADHGFMGICTFTINVMQQQDGGGGGSDNIKVVVRVRPLFPAESAKGAANVVQVNEDCSSMKVR